MYSSLIPYAAFTNFTPALPEFYWDVYSAEQRIKHLCMELCKLVAYSDALAEEINATNERLDNGLDEIQKNLDKEIANFRAEMLRLINSISLGILQWDCQTGSYTISPDAQRDMFNDVTVHAYNNEQLEEIYDNLGMTVDELANCGLNVKGYAVLNHVLLKPNSIPEDMIPENPAHEGMYTVEDLMNSYIDLDGYVYKSGN